VRLDPEICYRALASRDARFDGRFFTGVLSTGIYCRPICPARTPRRENVRFFACAAAASQAGLRPCLRCRPEASPGTPGWLGTSATVSRALGLIGEGALDRGSADALAARLGIGERHLRRLFDEHLGASPLAVAQTRRVHFAKMLMDETDLSASKAAFAAGFSSIRRFNAAMRAAYGRSPTEIRKASRRASSSGGDAGLELRLALRLPFDWEALVGFLGPRATPGVERISSGVYRRSIAVEDVVGVIEVRRAAEGGAVLLRVPVGASRALVQIVARVRRLFDLDADPAEITSQLSREPRLARILRRVPGLRVPGAWDGFELAVRAILGQQVSVRRATELAGRLVASYGKPLPQAEGGLHALFPGPEALLRADPSRLGLPRARAEAIRALAAGVKRGALELDAPVALEVALEQLTALPGVGPWTAHYVAMRAMREPDAFPAGDLGLRRALADGGRPLTPAKLASRAESWRPWRAYAAMALWTELASS
jgi:AraC family transcriptional regulator of adaptative response / DNA-3-methyladenine glycosylase II